jgi:hypothetical protein
MSEYNSTLFEACEYLNRSKKSISRYIRRDLLHPKKVKSQQGTLEYRFSESDLNAFKENENRQDKTRQDIGDTQDKIGQIKQTEQEPINPELKSDKDETRRDETRRDTEQTGQDNDIVSLLKETTGLLKEQLKVKDDQIKGLGDKIDQLIERDRETNIILKGLQDKVLMLEQPKQNETDKTEQTGQDKEKTKNIKKEKVKKEKPIKSNTKTDKKTKKGFFTNLFK